MVKLKIYCLKLMRQKVDRYKIVLRVYIKSRLQNFGRNVKLWSYDIVDTESERHKINNMNWIGKIKRFYLIFFLIILFTSKTRKYLTKYIFEGCQNNCIIKTTHLSSKANTLQNDCK